MWKGFLASVMFFTCLPLWRLVEVPSEYYKKVVGFWPVIGLLTGGVTATLFLIFSQLFSPITALVLAYAARTILTGALHEDGLADFFDGLGGGTTRERILAIMKDSHIGTYGVLGLIFYYLILISTLGSIALYAIPLLIVTGDVWSKFIASQIVNVLPYARTQEQAKNKTVYNRTPGGMVLLGLVINIGLFVLAQLVYTQEDVFKILSPDPATYYDRYPLDGFLLNYTLPILTFLVIWWLLKKKINGYTGDCCGAMFLLCELSFFLGAAIAAHLCKGPFLFLC